jgi:hypothetical protein
LRKDISMAVATSLVCCLLLTQPPPGTRPAPPVQEEAAGPLVPVPTHLPRQTPEQMMADGLKPLDEQPLPGRPVSLLDALSRTVGRARQLDMIRNYWRVAIATAEYHFRRDEFAQIQAMAARAAAEGSQATAEQTNRLLLEQASASARLRQAELRVVAAQTELAERFGLPPSEPLPLAADVPLTGPYLTKLKELFQGRLPPPRLQLIDQLIPLRYEVVVARAEAVQAAGDALQGVKDQYQRRELEGDRVAPRVADLGQQRAAFLTAVLDYNFDIAEYALATAPETAAPSALLPTLIKIKSPPPPGGPTSPPRNNPPTATPDEQPPAGSGQQAQARNGELRSVLVRPGETLDERPQRRLRLPTSDQAAADEVQTETASADQPLFAGLLDMEPPRRTHRLTKLLHRPLTRKPLGNPTSLSECLALAAPAERPRVITAYWQARQSAALSQAVLDRVDQLAALERLVLEASSAPGGAEAMLLLRTSTTDAQAELLEARASFLASQYELSTLVGRAATTGQLLSPTTPPHGGRYQLRTDVEPRTINEAHRIAQLSDAVADLHALLEDRSEAVTRADVARNELAGQYQQGKQPLESVLSGVARQADETRRFLEALTRYNGAIADYVLAVTPTTVPVPQLAAAMVVNP